MSIDKIGAVASAVCAVHCLITGLALGLLSVAGFGILGSVVTDLVFLCVALGVGAIAIVHGVRKHHSVLPALVFLLGVGLIAFGHLGFRHVHGGQVESDRILSAVFSIGGAICLVLFHVLNQQLRHRCACEHCHRPQG